MAISLLAKLIELPVGDGMAQGARLQTRSRPGDLGWLAEDRWER